LIYSRIAFPCTHCPMAAVVWLPNVIKYQPDRAKDQPGFLTARRIRFEKK